MAKDPEKFCKHILSAIDEVEDFTSNVSKKEFFDSKLIQRGVVRELEIIGEASKNLPSDFKRKYSEIPWRDIGDTRNQLIHGYFDVDFDLVWKIINEDLPSLKKEIQKILEDYE